MTPSVAALACPKCRGAMRVYERNGVTVDQCEECRGVFLDRGELDRLIDAEAGFYRTPPTGPSSPPPPTDGGYASGRYRDPDSQPGHGGHDSQRRRKRGGFLSDLFD